MIEPGQAEPGQNQPVYVSREQLVAENQAFVRALAVQIHRGLPRSVDLDDLVAYGQIGLHEAAKAFDLERGGKFTTFAYYRIRGAIFDGLGKMAWFTRRQQRQARYERSAESLLSLNADDGVDADRPEAVADWLGKMAGKLAVAYLASSGDDDSHDSQEPADDSAPAPDEQIIEQETKQILARVLDGLPADAGLLIRGIYYEGLTIQEAGLKIGISKAWASRLHAKTLEKMAKALSSDESLKC